MARRNHIVKINEQQYDFLKGGDTKHFSGNSEVSVGGQLNPDEDGMPKTTDEIRSMVTAQGYNRWPRRICKEDLNQRGIKLDPFYDNKQVDKLSNGNEGDDTTIISNTIDQKLEAFIELVKRTNPSRLQRAAIANKFIESLDLSDIPYKDKKDLRLKIQ